MFKKSLLLTVSLALVLGSFGSIVSASTATLTSSKGTVSSSNYFSIGNDDRSKKVLSSSTAISPYITIGNDNFLHIAPEAKNVVDSDVFATYQLGVERINEAIDQGYLQVNNGQLSLPEFQTYSFGNVYWWGVAITFDDQETKNQVYTLQQTGQGFTLVAAIAALIPGGQVAAVSAAAAGAIVAVGASMIANSMAAHNEGRGVTLNLHWLPLPYYTVNANS